LIGFNALFNSPSDMERPAYEGRGIASSLMMSPDVALAGMNGAPMPGSGGGHAARVGEISNPRRTSRPSAPQNMVPHRYYVNQTNRVPRIRYQGSGDPFNQNEYAADVSARLNRMSGGQARVNIVHDATSRRMSELELQDSMRDDLRGGR